MGFIQTTIELALEREELRSELLNYLEATVKKESIR